MDLYLQFGYGMKEHCSVLLRKWGKGTIILSPRDLTPEQIPRFSKEFIKLNGSTLLDPQLYYTKANHHRLTSHNYWPDNYSTNFLTDGIAISKLLKKISTLNDECQSAKYIVPGLFCRRVDEDWFVVQETLNDKALSIMSDKKRLATICLSADALRFEDQVEEIINRSKSWDVDGYYVVPEHPSGQYLVDDPLWLSNLLILCSGLKLQGREVIVGYSTHQLLCLATANVDAISSGTWLNVRSFTLGKFHDYEEESPSRRAKWYYCPQSLSEYKLPFLDLAFRAKILEQLAPDRAMGTEFANILFSGAQPSATVFSERDSFRHYLDCLHYQCNKAKRTTFRKTVDACVMQLETAERFIKMLHKNGIRGQDRDFSNIIDVNRAALSVIEETRGFVLDRKW